ncbi:MAG: pyridoxal phosphate-dependent aminotransferase [Myxococcota bacterium]
MFSRRSGFSRVPNRLARLCSEGAPVLDLASANPTQWGFDRPEAVARLGAPEGRYYAPEPRGAQAVRAAIVRYYRRRGAAVDPDDVIVSASSSEAYGWLFKLLCDPGDVVLFPEPSYPLVPYLATLDGVSVQPYALVRADGWRIDVPRLEALLERTPQARAIIVVHPGNPTGALVAAEERVRLDALGRAHGVALIADEVFFDYRHTEAESFAAGENGGVLRFVLSGLSKVALLPQLKLGWCVVAGGTPTTRREARERLTLISDCYLSVSTAAQLVAPSLLDDVEVVQAALRARLAQNRTYLASCCRGTPVSVWPSDGGWYALLSFPRVRDDDDWLEVLVRRARISVQPGYFYDIAEEGTFVVSLLLPPDVFADAVTRLVATVCEHA